VNERQESESQAILRRRAKRLAQVPPTPDDSLDVIDVILFSLAAEIYAVESSFVREVYPLKEYTPLPGVPAFVLGIVNVRGQIRSIVNLKIFFDLPAQGLGQLNKLIILYNDEMEFGILADEILGAQTLAVAEIQAVPPTVSGVGATYLRGVTADQVIILDAARLLSDEAIVVFQTVT
jgi:purine-binding chemotaxis protein CheW